MSSLCRWCTTSREQSQPSVCVSSVCTFLVSYIQHITNKSSNASYLNLDVFDQFIKYIQQLIIPNRCVYEEEYQKNVGQNVWKRKLGFYQKDTESANARRGHRPAG